jgi:hypothetical protein
LSERSGNRRGPARIAGVLLLALVPHFSMAAETIYAVVERDGDNYLVEFLVRLNAPLGRVRAITDDYERFPALSPTIIESEVLERRNDGSLRIKVVLRPCVLVFCKRITKTSDAERMAGGEVRYVADARASDFYAAIEWLWVEPDERRGPERGADRRVSPEAAGGFLPQGDATLIRYRAHLMPRFFVPPLVGPWLVRRQILHELSVVAERVELLAAPGGKR